MLDQLNPMQREAAGHTEGPLLILAGAGSGKTRVLTYRMAYLLQECGLKPWNIFAVTFTNKAAGEMKQRVNKLLGANVAGDMWVSTFHSACLKLLRRHSESIGYKKDFTIYDDKDQQQIISLCLDELNINTKMLPPRQVAFWINSAKNNAQTPNEFKPPVFDFFGDKIQAAYELYQKKIRINQAMDFGDLIFNTYLMFLNNPEILDKYSEQFAYLHVDEYQDTNRVQYLLIRELARRHRNICVVGDDDQSIYKFRGAEIKNILDFQKDYPDAFVVRLEQNYRSTGHILKAASAVVAKNLKRMGKTLWTENPDGNKIGLFQGITEKDESKFVVDQIQKHKESFKYDQMAIIYRTNAQSRSLEDELRRARIPYVIIGGMKFYDRAEIKDVISYLKVLVNPADSISLKRIINVPSRGIGKTTLEKLEEQALLRGFSLWAMISESTEQELGSLVNRGTVEKLKAFIRLMLALKEDLGAMPLNEYLDHLYKKSGYWQMHEAEKTVESQSRLENLEEFITVINEYCISVEDPTLAGFLDQSSLASDLDNFDKAEVRLPLMTFHLAKGLEFPLVFMVGLEEGLFPHERSLQSEEDIEEERRLCYVGMTRAEKQLYISFVRERSLFGATQYNLPSRFLEEIPKECIETISDRFRKSNFDGGTAEGLSSKHIEERLLREVSSPYKAGHKVKHPIFGVGTIKVCEGSKGDEKLTIAFANGQTKKILAKYANLDTGILS